MSSVFGDENAEACFELVGDFFANPPMFGPRAVFLVYPPGAMEDPSGLCRSLEEEARRFLPEGSPCAFRAVMKGDSGFAEVANDVLWFDLETGEAFPPEKRKLGFKNKNAAAPAQTSSKPHPGIGLDESDEIPLLVIPDSSAKKKKNGKSLPVGTIVKTAIGLAVLAAAGIYIHGFFNSPKPAPKQQRRQANEPTVEKKIDTPPASETPSAEEVPSVQEPPAAPEPTPVPEQKPAPETEEEPTVARNPAQDPYEPGKGPRQFSDLTRRLGTGGFVWGECRPEGDSPDVQPEGSVWWLVCAQNPDEKNSPADFFKVTVGAPDAPPVVVPCYDGKPADPIDPAKFAKLRAERPHAELFGEECYIFVPGGDAAEKDYAFPRNFLFDPAKIDLGEAFCKILQSSGSGNNSKTGNLLWEVEFHYNAPEPVTVSASIDRPVNYSDIYREVQALRKRRVEELRLEEEYKPAKQTASGGEPASRRESRNGSNGGARRGSGFSGGHRRSSSRPGLGGDFGGGFRGGRGSSRSGLGSGIGGGFSDSRRSGFHDGDDDSREVSGDAPDRPQPPRAKTPLEEAQAHASRQAIERDMDKGKLRFRRKTVK